MKNIFTLFLVTLLSTYTLAQNSFTSNNATPSADFNTVGNWTDDAAGGAVPDFTNGLDNFTIADGHDYSSSGALSIDVLIIGQGVAGGSLTLGSTLVMGGNLLLDINSTIAAGANQINIAGNWTENTGASLSSTGLVVFDASLVQTISTAATFNNLTFNGSGVVATGGNVTVNGNWIITNNTNFTSGNAHTLSGDLTVDDGSIYSATDGRLTLNGSVAQALNIGTNATFDEVYFNPGAAVTYTITGDYVANDLTRVYSSATLNGAGDQTIQEFRQEGICNFSSSITFTAGTVYDNDDNTLTLGTANVVIDGNVFFSSGGNDDITLGGDLTINSGYLVLNEGSTTGAGGTFQINDGTTVYVRGVDNFPGGFGAVDFQGLTSRANYDLRADQTIRGGITYARLALGAGSGTDTGGRTKTVDGVLDINGYLDLNNAVTLATLNFDHTLEGYLYNGTNSSITNTGGTFTLDAPDARQDIQTSGTGSYNFSSLLITNTAPTAVRTINFDDNNTQVTNFSVTNLGGSATNYLILDIDANLMVGFGSYTVGANVQLRTSGASEFNSMMAFFTESFDPQSTIRFDGTTQSIPGITYGNVELSGNGNKNVTGDFIVTGNFSRVGGTPILVDGGRLLSVAGNWVMGTAYTNNMTGLMTFNGSDQTISGSDFHYLSYSGSGTKTIVGDHFVSGDLTINNGVIVDEGIYSIDMTGGHWVNGGTGVFSQTTGTVYFSSAGSGQNITSNSNNVFGDLDIENGASRTVTAQTDIIVSRDFDIVQNLGDFNIQGFTLTVGRHFYYRTGTTFSSTLPAATIHFNGDVAQSIRNYASGTYPNMIFSGLGEKDLYDNGFNIDGDVTITTTTLDANNYSHTVAGDWANNGSFQHTQAITFDGTDQTISASTFHDTFYSGSGTKTLAGNITLNGRLQINNGVTLDVSASNYRITVEERWNNTGSGIFTPRNGTVEFSGGYSQMFTGASGFPDAGKHFWDVLINTNTSRAELDGDLIVENDFTINAGAELETDHMDMYVAGSFINQGVFDFNSNNSLLTFNGTSGVNIIDPGGSSFRFTTFDAFGAEYELQRDLFFNIGNNYQPVLTIIDGTFDLNGNEVLFSTSYILYIDIVGGTLEVDEGASLRMGRDSKITNSGGTFKIVGTAENPAVVNSLDPDIGDYFDYTQTGGTIEAQFYSISNTTGNGFNLTGGTIDPTNSFLNGVFSNGAGTAYLTIDIPFSSTLSNVVFNAGPTFNVSAPVDHSGALAIDFEDALGGLSGEANDSDVFDQITWSFSGSGVVWDGGGDGISWNDGSNWDSNVIPTATDVIYVDHSIVGGAYSVDIVTLDALGLKLIVDAGGSNDISLTVKNGRVLDIEELMTIIDGSLIQENSSTIRLAGAWSNSGTYTANTNAFILDGTTGVYTFNTDTDPFYNLTVDASGAQYNLDNNMVINNDFNINGGIFNVVGNKRITLLGDMSTNGGSFLPGTGEVRFSGTSDTQTIYGGLFYDLSLRDAAAKQLTSNVTIEDDFTLHSGFTNTFDAQEYVIKVGDDWVNDKDATAFTQSGAGAVIFNGGGQLITGASSTTFNSLYFSGSGTKIFQISANVNQDMNILNGVGRVEIDPSVTVTGTIGGTLSQTGGELRIEGFNNFPNGFGTINLVAGGVNYYSNADQNIYSTTYFDLSIGRPTFGNTPIKTLLGDITINDDLYIGDIQSILNADNFTINLEDALSIPSGGQQVNWGAAGGTGTLNHFGDYWSIDTDITGFNNLIFAGSGTKYMNSALAITGDVTINDGITLDMNSNTMTGVGTESFTMLGSSRVITDNITDPLPAFPTAFGTYSLATTSRVTLNGGGDQSIFTTPTYGRLDVNSGGNATLDGNLDVDGDFYMNDNPTLVDTGFDMNLSGSIVDIRGYTPTIGTTVTFDGADQTIQDNDATSTDYLDFANIVFGGTGTKTLTGYQDHYRIYGDLTINNSITVNLSRNLDFTGTNFANSGTLNHTNNTINFNATGVQTIDPGADHTFQTTRFENAGGAKTIINNGLNIDGGQIEFFSNATVDFGSLTHNFAITSVNDDATETLITANANVVYDRTGTQTITKDRTWSNITFGGTGTKNVDGVLTGNDITVNSGVTLRMSSDAGTTVGSFIVQGNWANAGSFADYTSTIAFESTDGTAKTIDNNGFDFYNVTFNQTDVNVRSYTLLLDQIIQEDLTIGNGATFDVNGFDLTLGNNDGGSPDAEQHHVQSGATLTISAGSSLLFDASDNGSDDTSDPDPTLTVDGTFNLVGASGDLARVARVAGNYEIDIDIQTGGTINARYYEIGNLVDGGLDVQSGAIVGNTPNNFSDGNWTAISTATSGDFVYLNIEADVTGIGDINNVTFNHGASPVQGVHYNVRRSGAATGTITFAGTINGILAGEFYEDDNGGVLDPGLIVWPPLSFTTWTGLVDENWSDAGNWTSGVPTVALDALIGLEANNPVIDATSADGSVKSITITDGFLTLNDGNNLNALGDVIIGQGTSTGILAVANSTSDIFITGGLTFGPNAIYIPDDAKITFNATGGTVTITPNNATLQNLTFTGAATYLVTGSSLDINGDINISNGVLSFSTNNYTANIAGDILNNGGSFDTSTSGLVVLDGANQAIKDVDFNDLTVSGTLTKTLQGTVDIADDLIVNSTLSAGTATLTMNGDVTIAGSGTFNDGGGSHTFNGPYWTGTGAYTGSGTIVFSRTGNQYINASKFNNLDISGSNTKYLDGDTDLTGDLTLRSTIASMRLGTSLFDNTSGTGTFTTEAGISVYILGTNNYPSGFATYSPEATSLARYEGTIDQTVRGVQYGRLYLLNSTTKTLSGDIDVDGDLDFNTAILDVSATNYEIVLAGEWDNNNGGTFIARNGQVVLDGSAAGYQNIRADITGTKDFYDLKIDKPANAARYLGNGVDVTVLNSLIIQNGTFRNEYTNRGFYIGGDINCIAGTLENDGNYVLNKASGTGFITTNGSTLYDLDINTGGTYLVQDDLDVGNLFSVTAGTFNANGKTVKLGNNLDVATITGTYIAGAGGRLELGDNVSFTVTAAGTLDLVGSSGSPITITRRGASSYNFSVQGNVSARYYLFEYMATNGIKIENGATIDPTNNFSDGTFTNGASGGTLFNIENIQDINGDPGRINNVSFPSNPGGGASNVSKLIAGSGTVEFYDATGAFRGSGFETDPSNLINWTGTETLTWTSGAGTNDWFTAANWESSLGGNKVPTPADLVIIDSNPVIQPVITVDGDGVTMAEAKTLTIDFGAILTLNTSTDDANADLDVSGDIDINGIFITNGAEDRIKISGAWTRGGSGSFTQSTSKVDFATSGGIDVINNGTSPFYDVTIESGNYQLGSNTVIQNDFTVDVGASFDVTSSNYQLTITADFSNSGTFNSQSGLVLFNTSSVGARTIDAGGASFYNLDINGNAGATFSLQSTTTVLNDFDLIGGDLSLNGNTLNMGDPTGSDILTVGGTSTLVIGANGTLSMGASTTIQVNSGATLQAVGTDASNKAIINSQSGTYAFVIASGAQLDAQFYEINNLNATGLNIQSGASLHATNNLSDGSFSNGAAGGRYLLLENDLGSDITLNGVVFNSGPAINAKRVTGNNAYIFNDASGVLAGSAFEEDDGVAGTGKVQWIYTSLITWDGSTDTDWNDGTNWAGGSVPGTGNDVVIPSGMPNDPVLNSGANGAAKDLTIQAGATMTLAGSIDLDLSGAFINSGGFTHTNGILSVEGSWTNVGTYTAATGSTVQLDANTGNILVETGGDAFCTLILDSDAAGDGDAVFQTVDALTVNCDFYLTDGTLEISNAAHSLTMVNSSGTSNFDIDAASSFVHGSGTINLQSSGTGILFNTNSKSLYNVATSGSGTITFSSNASIINDLMLGTATAGGAATISLQGNITNTSTFTSNTSTLLLIGATTQTVTSTGGISFNNLTVNNTSGIHPQIVLNDAVTVTGALTLTDGVISSSVTDFIHVNGGTVAGASSASYVDGPMQITRTGNITFPVGDGLIYARIGAESTTLSNGFTAQYFDAAAPNSGNVVQTGDGGALNHVSGAEYWDLARTSGVSDPLVRLYWEDGTRSEITDLTGSDLVVAHYTAGNWESEGQGSTTGTTAVGSVLSASTLASLSPLTFGSAFNVNALPIELLSFNAEVMGKTVKLEWETASELNNDYFTLLRSKDGESFEDVATIIGAGNSAEVLSYSFVDERPYNGISYYKLVQTDFDGTSADAGVILVRLANNVDELELVSFPNPFNNQGVSLSLSGLNKAEIVSVLVVDAFGRQHYLDKQQATDSGYLDFTITDVSKWTSGVYVVRVIAEKGVIQTKIIKK